MEKYRIRQRQQIRIDYHKAQAWDKIRASISAKLGDQADKIKLTSEELPTVPRRIFT